MDDDAEWLLGKAEYAPDEDTEARYRAIAERLSGQEQSLCARWDRIQELEAELNATRLKLAQYAQAALAPENEVRKRVHELQSKLEAITAGFAIEHEKFLKANERATGAESRLHSIRKDTIQECWNLITSHVQHGELPTLYQNEQRNGMALAANILFHLADAVDSVEGHAATTNMTDGERVEVLLGGDDEWYAGTVIKARKMWVQLDDDRAIADEGNIRQWRRIVETSCSFDEQIERDAKAGKLDWLADEAREALKRGDTEPL